jgi:hypothetical protein
MGRRVHIRARWHPNGYGARNDAFVPAARQGEGEIPDREEFRCGQWR